MSTAPKLLQPGTALRRIVAALAAVIVILTLLTTPRFTPPADAQPAQTSPTGVCGGSIALVFDLSHNVNSGTLDLTKSVAVEFVEELQGSHHEVGVYSFATNFPARGNANLAPVSTRTPEGVGQIVDAIDGLTQPRDQLFVNHTGSNWEGGLQQVAQSTTDYDSVFFITGGPPDHDNNGSNRVLAPILGDLVQDEEIAAAAAQAALLADRGSRVIPVGVGNRIHGDITVYRGTTVLGGWYTRPAEDILGDIATGGGEVLQARGTGVGALPDRMRAAGLPTCVQVTKNLVDADGEVTGPGQGWEFDATLSGAPDARLSASTLVTDADGHSDATITGLRPSQTADLTLVEEQRPSHRLRPVDGRAAVCTITRPGVGDVDAPTQAAGDAGVRVTGVQVGDAVSCAFHNQGVVPLNLTKTVTANPDALLSEVSAYTFDFDYECRVDGDVVASGTAEEMAAGETRLLHPEVPVGAECTVTELVPPTDPVRQILQATWNVSGGDVRDTDEPLSVSFRVNDSTSDGSVTVGVTNNYLAQTAALSVEKNVTGALPASDVPAQFPVRYFCRYIPDPDERPELGGGGVNPGDVGSGHLTVSPGSPGVIDDLPVGTQCGFEEVAEDGSTPDVDGFTMSTTWESDACLDYRGAGSGVRECQANYIRVPESGSFTLEITNDYQRVEADLPFVVELDPSGEAAARGVDQVFLFDVVCVAGGETTFTAEGVEATPGLATTVRGVPVGAECTVTESGTDLPGVDVAHTDAPPTVTVPVGGPTEPVDVPLTLSFQRSDLSVVPEFEIDAAITDAELLLTLPLEAIPVVAECRPPGAATATARTIDVPLTGPAVSVGDLPVGTVCRFHSDYVAPDGADAHITFAPVSREVSATGPNDVTMNVHYAQATASLAVTHSASFSEPVADAEQLVADEYIYTYACVGGVGEPVSGQFELTPGEVGYTEVPAGSECLVTLPLTQNEPLNPALDRESTWTAIPASAGAPGSDGITVSIPAAGDEGIAVRATHLYSPARSQATVTQTSELANPDGSTPSAEVSEAILGGRGHLVAYACTRNGERVDTASQVMTPGESRSVQLPVGADCVFTAEADPITSADGPEISWSGTGADTDGGYLVTPTRGGAETVGVEHGYTVRLGGFNLKKKVDGDGVSTIHSGRDFRLNYVCTLGGVQVAEGYADVGRFDNGADHPVRDIPVGADCVVTEDEASAAETDESGTQVADVTPRWTLAPDRSGLEAAEVPCTSAAGCQTTPGSFEASLTVLDRTVQEEEYFQGTLIVWNTYDYHETRLQVTNELAGDGPELAADDEFTYSYVCTDPRYAGSELEQFGIPDPTVRGTVSVTGAGPATERAPDPANPAEMIDVPSKPIWIGFDCVITQNLVAGYDADVTAAFEGEDPVDATQESATATLTTQEELRDQVHELTVVNDYQRQRAGLMLASAYDVSRDGDVSAYLEPSDAPLPVQWVCEDPVLGTTYSGTATPPIDGGEQEILRPDAPEGVDARLPAAADCVIVGGPELGRIPAGYEDVVQTDTRHLWTETAGADTVERDRGGGAVIDGVTLTAGETTRVAFTTAYYVPQAPLGVVNHVEGDDGEDVVREGDAFTYEYVCELPGLLPNQPAPFDPAGSVSLGRDEAWVEQAPAGSNCEITPQPVDEGLAERIEENNLRLQLNYAFAGGAGEPSRIIPTPEEPIVIDNTIDPDAPERNVAHAFQSLFREDGELQVQKVNPDGEPLAGARFAIYPAAPAGPADEPVVEDMAWVEDDGAPDRSRFTARLLPGTYYLVETRSGDGSELLPQPWRFTVSAVGGEDALGDVEITLASETEYSGLIEIVEPTEQTPWVVQVANLAVGELPLTGGRGVWPGLLAGAGALLAAGAWFLLGRRRD